MSGYLSRGVINASARQELPVYDDARNVDVSTIGGNTVVFVYLTGSVQEPAGLWYYEGAVGQWFSGDRTRISAQQQSISANSTVVLQEFDLPSNTEVDIWQLQVTNVSGTDDGLILDVHNSTQSNTIAEYKGDDHDGEVQFGDPIAQGGSGGDTIQVRVRNTTGGSKDATGFVVISIQSTLT